MTDPAKTGASDTTYDLTSILYHALQGAQVSDQYLKDARQAGDQDLVDFFEEVRDQDKERAVRSQELLARKISG